jgi:aspartyl-tRNA(Asn)/glutamyl-tRNA(Gln) amidotransferase subunit A
MGSDELAYLGAAALQRAYRERRLSPVEVTGALIARLERFDGAYRTHTTLCAEGALAAAAEAEATFARDPNPAPLTGIPVSHKDNLKSAGVYTGAHSRSSFAGVPNESATAVARLEGAGAILLGKTNTTEFACGDQLEHGDTPNPWDPTLYSGASSAGSASALAAGFVPLATGTDTGGSIRAPAALCGIVGVKPTFGRVSRYGLIPLTWSMDHVGPMARSVEDAALMLQAMAGFDPRDPSSSRAAVPDYLAALDGNLAGLRIGVGVGHFETDLEPAVARAFGNAVEVARGLGAHISFVELPMAGMLGSFARILTMWEAFALHAGHLRREAHAYGPKARAHIASGGFFDAADVSLALQLRERWIDELDRTFGAVDAILTPTLPFTAVSRAAWVQNPPTPVGRPAASTSPAPPRSPSRAGATNGGSPSPCRWLRAPLTRRRCSESRTRLSAAWGTTVYDRRCSSVHPPSGTVRLRLVPTTTRPSPRFGRGPSDRRSPSLTPTSFVSPDWCGKRTRGWSSGGSSRATPSSRAHPSPRSTPIEEPHDPTDLHRRPHRPALRRRRHQPQQARRRPLRQTAGARQLHRNHADPPLA